MPRWKALPEELDPQLREFANQLRRLVERSGLSLSAIADRTGYSKTSWERYLNGRLLPPRGAAEALAEATGTSAVHLGTMWELAERAWSRSEMRHDVTMEAMRVAQARAALGEFGPPPPKPAKNGGRRQTPSPGSGGISGPGEGDLGSAAVPPPSRPKPPTSTPGHSGSTDKSDRTDRNDRTDRTSYSAHSAPSAHSGYTPRSGTPRPGHSDDSSSPPGQPSGAKASPSGAGVPPSGPRGGGPSPAASDAQRRRRRVTMFLAGLVGTLLVIAAAVLLIGVGGDSGDGAKSAESASPSASAKPKLPAGVKCVGQDCTGKDPEAMGCGGASATTSASATIGSTYVEVRYSKVCGAYWARITQAVPGDTVQVAAAAGTAGKARTENGKVERDADAYTPMVAASAPLRIKACATLATGEKGCTPATAAPPSPAGSPVG
ncbi:DUF2690 domain-containing protein [Streptomyces sp. NPDC050610]|uniref:helix-turn-helix domain-containing protein n=1 Tax=Streptomyces sp. NPDC050610 TaxID=3157097 RepID=UPI00341F7D18